MSMFDLAKRVELANPMSESNIEVNYFLFSNWELETQLDGTGCQYSESGNDQSRTASD